MAEFNKVLTDDDILQLMERVNDFHDTCIDGASYRSGMYVSPDLAMGDKGAGEYVLELRFRRQEEPSYLTLRFTGVRLFRIAGFDEGSFNAIFDARIEFAEGLISDTDDRVVFWSDCAGHTPCEAMEKPYVSFVAADGLEWSLSFGCN